MSFSLAVIRCSGCNKMESLVPSGDRYFCLSCFHKKMHINNTNTNTHTNSNSNSNNGIKQTIEWQEFWSRWYTSPFGQQHGGWGVGPARTVSIHDDHEALEERDMNLFFKYSRNPEFISQCVVKEFK